MGQGGLGSMQGSLRFVPAAQHAQLRRLPGQVQPGCRISRVPEQRQPVGGVHKQRHQRQRGIQPGLPKPCAGPVQGRDRPLMGLIPPEHHARDPGQQGHPGLIRPQGFRDGPAGQPGEGRQAGQVGGSGRQVVQGEGFSRPQQPRGEDQQRPPPRAQGQLHAEGCAGLSGGFLRHPGREIRKRGGVHRPARPQKDAALGHGGQGDERIGCGQDVAQGQGGFLRHGGAAGQSNGPVRGLSGLDAVFAVQGKAGYQAVGYLREPLAAREVHDLQRVQKRAAGRIRQGGQGALQPLDQPRHADTALRKDRFALLPGPAQAVNTDAVADVEQQALGSGGVAGEAGQADSACAHDARTLGGEQQAGLRRADDMGVHRQGG